MECPWRNTIKLPDTLREQDYKNIHILSLFGFLEFWVYLGSPVFFWGVDKKEHKMIE